MAKGLFSKFVETGRLLNEANSDDSSGSYDQRDVEIWARDAYTVLKETASNICDSEEQEIELCNKVIKELQRLVDTKSQDTSW